jgi:hypothetical protein
MYNYLHVLKLLQKWIKKDKGGKKYLQHLKNLFCVKTFFEVNKNIFSKLLKIIQFNR